MRAVAFKALSESELNYINYPFYSGTVLRGLGSALDESSKMDINRNAMPTLAEINSGTGSTNSCRSPLQLKD
jgi:hypothetical protein